MRAQAARASCSSATHETASSATVAASYVEAERLLLVSNTQTDRARARRADPRGSPEHALITKLARGVLDGRAHGRWALDAGEPRRRCRRCAATSIPTRRPRRATPASCGSARPRTPSSRSSAASTHARSAQARLDGARPRARRTTSRSREDGTGPHVLPRRHHLRAEAGRPAARSTPASSCAALHRGRRSERRHQDCRTAATRSSSARACSSRLETINTTLRHGVAFVDPLPAGFETVNTRLATAERAVGDDSAPLGLHEPARQPQRGVRDGSARGHARVRVHRARRRRPARSSPRPRRRRRCTAPRRSAARRVSSSSSSDPIARSANRRSPCSRAAFAATVSAASSCARESAGRSRGPSGCSYRPRSSPKVSTTRRWAARAGSRPGRRAVARAHSPSRRSPSSGAPESGRTVRPSSVATGPRIAVARSASS